MPILHKLKTFIYNMLFTPTEAKVPFFNRSLGQLSDTNILLERKLKIPIYQAVVYLVVAEDLKAARLEQKMVDLFGPPPEGKFFGACSYDMEGTFALFFTPGHMMPCDLAHEIYHLTHMILEWRDRGEPSAEEEGAYLCQYLTDIVYKALDDPWNI